MHPFLYGPPVDLARQSPGFREPIVPELFEIGGEVPEIGQPANSMPARLRREREREFECSFLAFEDVQRIHEALVEDFARSHDPIFPPGIKSREMLDSAIARQWTSLGGEQKYRTIHDVAASLFFGIAVNHAFHNGNKRTALVALISLLDLNHHVMEASEDELFDFVLAVVTHGFRPDDSSSHTEQTDEEVETIGLWIGRRLRRVQRGDKALDFRRLRKLLESLGCTVGRSDKGFISVTRQNRRTVVAYDGEGREVGRTTIQKLRADLDLTEEDGIDSEIFYGRAAPLDKFIVKYRTLLQRLANV